MAWAGAGKVNNELSKVCVCWFVLFGNMVFMSIKYESGSMMWCAAIFQNQTQFISSFLWFESTLRPVKKWSIKFADCSLFQKGRCFSSTKVSCIIEAEKKNSKIRIKVDEIYVLCSVNTLNDGDDDVLFAQDMNFMNMMGANRILPKKKLFEECNERSAESG